MADAFRSVEVTRVRGGTRTTASDRAATEEPLEVRLHGRPFAVIMRTPGADKELAAGFLLSERVLRSADDLGTIEYCTDKLRPIAATASDSERCAPTRKTDTIATAENVISVTLVGRSNGDLEAFLADRRQTMTNSSCGLCGRQTIESLQADVPPLSIGGHVHSKVVSTLPQQLRETQQMFDETGGLHAAGLF